MCGDGGNRVDCCGLLGRRTNAMTSMDFRKPWQHLRDQLCTGNDKRPINASGCDSEGRTATFKDEGVSWYGSLPPFILYFLLFIDPLMIQSYSVHVPLGFCADLTFRILQKLKWNVVLFEKFKSLPLVVHQGSWQELTGYIVVFCLNYLFNSLNYLSSSCPSQEKCVNLSWDYLNEEQVIFC